MEVNIFALVTFLMSSILYVCCFRLLKRAEKVRMSAEKYFENGMDMVAEARQLLESIDLPDSWESEPEAEPIVEFKKLSPEQIAIGKAAIKSLGRLREEENQ